MLKPILLGVAILAPAAVGWAQSTEATRYVNGQGVEMIQNRPPPAPAPMPLVVPSGAAQGKTAVAAPAPVQPASRIRTTAVPAALAPDLQIAPDDQKARDRDRVNILRQELMKELGDYEVKNKVLRNPAAKASLDEQQLKRLQETLQAHERNIRDLNSEIARAVRH